MEDQGLHVEEAHREERVEPIDILLIEVQSIILVPGLSLICRLIQDSFELDVEEEDHTREHLQEE